MTATQTKVVGGASGVSLAGAVALRSLTLRNVLSFGAEATVELGPLNVLIGPNGCGKSNLVDVIALLKAAAETDLSDEFRGGAEDWVWNGVKKDKAGQGVMQIVSCWPREDGAFTHSMGIRAGNGKYSILRDEDIHWKWSIGRKGAFRRSLLSSEARVERADKDGFHHSGAKDSDRISLLNPVTPIHEEKNPLSGLGRRMLSDIVKNAQIYRSRQVGRVGALNPLHLPSQTDKPIDRLSEDLENFALVLNRVRLDREDEVVKALREIYEDARGLDVRIAYNRADIMLKEKGGHIPAHRMSDGTLNWLFMLAVLLDPNPPALVCIEEPETGLHPDILPTLARMLIDASKRMQIIVTTHSDMIVDCFTDLPEAVVVCDKVDGVTQMKRLCANDFHEWKEEGLGMAWTRGAIGGKRW